MPKSLIQTLDEIAHLGPDEIVAQISDPLATLFDMRRMTSEIWAKHKHRQVHWYRWVNNQWCSDTTNDEGELLGHSYESGWVDQPDRGLMWLIISNEALHTNGLPPEPPR